MDVPRDAKLLRIFISESDKHKGRPLYEVITERARANGLAEVKKSPEDLRDWMMTSVEESAKLAKALESGANAKA